MRPDHVLLRFTRSMNGYSKGAVIEYPSGPAKSLLLTGGVELVRDDQPLLEVGMVENRNVETADAPRRRGRKPSR